jgi:hypothetical protein
MKKSSILMLSLVIAMSLQGQQVGSSPFFTPQQKSLAKKSLTAALYMLETSIGILLLYLSGSVIVEEGVMRYKNEEGKWSDLAAPRLFGINPPQGQGYLNRAYIDNLINQGAAVPKALLGAGLTAHGLINVYRTLGIDKQLENIKKLIHERK